MRKLSFTWMLGILASVSCNFSNRFPASEENPPASFAVENCDREEAKKHLFAMFDAFDHYPAELSVLYIRSLQSCLGVVGYDAALEEIKQKYKIDQAKTDRPKRNVANTKPDPQQESYNSWKRRIQNWDLVTTAVDMTGTTTGAVLLVAAFPAALYIGVPAVGMATLAMNVYGGTQAAVGVMKTIGRGAEEMNAVYARQVIRDFKLDDKAIETARFNAGPDMAQQVKAVKNEISNQLGNANQRILSEPDSIEALTLGVKASIDYGNILDQRISAIGMDHQQVLQNLRNINENIKNFQGQVGKDLKEMRETMQLMNEQMEEMHGTSFAQVNFLLDLNSDKMSTSQKIFAMEKLNWASDIEDRDLALERLKNVQKIEQTLQPLYQHGAKLAQAQQILSNMGIHSPELNQVVDLTNKGMELGNAAMDLASGNYFGAAMKITGVFGVGAPDAGAARHAQIMQALGEIIRLQKQTLELLIDVSKRIDAGFEQMENNFRLVVQLQTMAWKNEYVRSDAFKLHNCTSAHSDLIYALLQSRYKPQQLAELGINWTSPSELAPEVAQHLNPGFDDIHLALSKSEEPVRDLRECLKSIRTLRGDLRAHISDLSPLKDKIRPLDPFLTSEGFATVFTDSSDAKNAIASRETRSALMKNFVQAVFRKKGMIPPPIAYGLLNPSETVDELLNKEKELGADNSSGKFEKALASHPLGEALKRQFFWNNGMSVIDPTMIQELAASHYRFLPLESLVGEDRILDWEESLAQEMTPARYAEQESLRLALDLAVFQQTFLNGDLLLQYLDQHTHIQSPPKDPREQQHIFKKMDSVAKGDLTLMAQALLSGSPQLLRNLIMYRLIKAMRFNSNLPNPPRYLYTLFRDGIEEDGIDYFLSRRLASSGLVVFKSQAKRAKKQWLIGLTGSDSGDLEHFAIPLPSSAEVMGGDLSLAPEIYSLNALRETALQNKYYHESMSNPKTRQRMILQRMQKATTL